MSPKNETIIRTVVLAVALGNQALTLAGANPLPFSDEQVYGAASGVLTLGATLWAWWKNNSFTREALSADAMMRLSKARTRAERRAIREEAGRG